MLLNDKTGFSHEIGNSGYERRENPRYNTSFLKRNLIELRDNSEIIYDGLVSILNISRDGMCVKITLPDASKADSYRSGKNIKILIDMPFIGKIITCCGTIAWVSPDFKPADYRMGLQFHNEEFSSSALLDLFDEEKKAQRKLFERLI
ncbi:MAG: PilZ domain-containing protein [Candidatus Auribacterota bacterium]|jgi:hypothetical protein|nr:PilZ domain-containing protein [Candidatus Auribacterota bacterium]